jgi:hypothetical protein
MSRHLERTILKQWIYALTSLPCFMVWGSMSKKLNVRPL